jgi:hypothetical protein
VTRSSAGSLGADHDPHLIQAIALIGIQGVKPPIENDFEHFKRKNTYKKHLII